MSKPVSLHVRGQAELQVPPDYAVVHLSIHVVNADRSSALAGAEQRSAILRKDVACAEGVRHVLLSRVRVEEQTRWDNQAEQHLSLGWQATVSGTVEVVISHVSTVVEQAVSLGSQVSWVDWQLDPDNPVFRDVRKSAVTDAFRAAADFAAAIDRPLGELCTLTDVGLLPTNQAGGLQEARMLLTPASEVPSHDFEFDPQPQAVSVTVEAVFEVV